MPSNKYYKILKNNYIIVLLLIIILSTVVFVFYNNIERFFVPAGAVRIGVAATVRGGRATGVLPEGQASAISDIVEAPERILYEQTGIPNPNIEKEIVRGFREDVIPYITGGRRLTCHNRIRIPALYCPILSDDLPRDQICCIVPPPETTTVDNMNFNNGNRKPTETTISAYTVGRRLYIFMNDKYYRYSFSTRFNLPINPKNTKDAGYPKNIVDQYGSRLSPLTNAGIPGDTKLERWRRMQGLINICAVFRRFGTGKSSKDGVLYIFKRDKYFKYNSSTDPPTITSGSNPNIFRIFARTLHPAQQEFWGVNKLSSWPSAIVQTNDDNIYFFSDTKYYIYPNKGGDIKEGRIRNLLYPRVDGKRPNRIDAACKHPNTNGFVYLFELIVSPGWSPAQTSAPTTTMHPRARRLWQWGRRSSAERKASERGETLPPDWQAGTPAPWASQITTPPPPPELRCYKYKIINENVWILQSIEPLILSLT